MLSDVEKDIIGQCMLAILQGPFIDDWEFHIRMGLDRDELRAILSRPELDYYSQEEGVQLAINNSMNELLNGVRISSTEWPKWVPASKEAVLGTYEKWRAENGSDHGRTSK